MIREKGNASWGGAFVRLLLSCATVGSSVVSAVLLSGFLAGMREGDPEYYLFIGAALAGLLAALWLFLLLSKR